MVREEALRQLVDGTWFDITEWGETEETVSGRLVQMENSIYGSIVLQSGAERKFAEKLKKQGDVRLFINLPNWFKVTTPVGQCNPDWRSSWKRLRICKHCSTLCAKPKVRRQPMCYAAQKTRESFEADGSLSPLRTWVSESSPMQTICHNPVST